MWQYCAYHYNVMPCVTAEGWLEPLDIHSLQMSQYGGVLHFYRAVLNVTIWVLAGLRQKSSLILLFN